jgi:hypothetical protein
MGTARGKSHQMNIVMKGDLRPLRFYPRSLDPRAATLYRAIQHTTDWLVDHSKDTIPFFRESDLDGEVTVAVDEARCPIERINHPNPSFLKSTISIYRLLRKNSVLAELARESLYN